MATFIRDIVASFNHFVPPQKDDDIIDRLHYSVTTNILVALSVLVSFKQFGGSPIECMCPDSFPSSWTQYLQLISTFVAPLLNALLQNSSVQVKEMYIFCQDRMQDVILCKFIKIQPCDIAKLVGSKIQDISDKLCITNIYKYAENFCWAQGTYFISRYELEPPTPEKLAASKDRKINYYQWVPFFMVFESICFAIPRFFWTFSSSGSGIRVSNIVDLAREKTNVRPEVRKNTLKILTTHFENALKFHRRIERRGIVVHKYFRCLNVQYTACYVTSVYLVTKILFLVNTVVQFRLMNVFLGTPNGVREITTLLNGTNWHSSGIFPRVTYCVVSVRGTASNMMNYTIQCVLMINLFNEKIFVFLWFWYLVLVVLTACSLFYWTCVLLIPCLSRRYITRHLRLADQPFSTQENSKHVNRFIHKYLKHDGVFVLRMVSMHTGVIFATDLILSLWNKYFGLESELQRITSAAESTDAAASEPETKPETLKLYKKPTSIKTKHSEKGDKDGDDSPSTKEGNSKSKDPGELDIDLVDVAALDAPLSKLTTPLSTVNLPPTDPRYKSGRLLDEYESSDSSDDENEESQPDFGEGKKEDHRHKLGPGQQSGMMQRSAPSAPIQYDCFQSGPGSSAYAAPHSHQFQSEGLMHRHGGGPLHSQEHGFGATTASKPLRTFKR